MHFRISYTMNAEDIFRSSIGCEIMLMIKARIRLIFSRYNIMKMSLPKKKKIFFFFFFFFLGGGGGGGDSHFSLGPI